MDLGLLVVRAVLGLGMAAHGAQKLFGWFGGYGLQGTGGWLESQGFRPGRLFALAAGLGELAGGLLVALGLLGPVGPGLVISVMIVAIGVAHLAHGFFAQNGGFELPLFYIAVSIAVALTGPGLFSLDRAVGLTALSRPAIAWAAIGLGILGGFANLAVRRRPETTPAVA
jgi:putative oxidoreductase